MIGVKTRARGKVYRAKSKLALRARQCVKIVYYNYYSMYAMANAPQQTRMHSFMRVGLRTVCVHIHVRRLYRTRTHNALCP